MRIGTREEWREARLELLAREKEHMRLGDELTRARQALPWVPVEKAYSFETEHGTRTLPELFDGRSQLLAYSFMFAPDWEEGCVGCSFLADHLDGPMPHVNARDVTVVCVSRAPLPKLLDYKRRMGWEFEWVSSHDSDFNYDFQASFTPEQQRGGGGEYNGEWLAEPYVELPGLNAFALADGVVHHTYTLQARGLEAFDTVYHLLDRAPKGRDEQDLEPRPGAWWRRHDEY